MKHTTSAQLTTAFAPIMRQSLDKVGAMRYYAQLAITYNHMPLGKPVQADLTRYTGKAVDGLFTLIAREEANIRQNPMARTTELLRRVFDGRTS